MSVPSELTKLVGRWLGTNKLFLSADDPGMESVSNACVGLEAGQNFLKINYDWVHEGGYQEGLMLFRVGDDLTADSVWIDSFHQHDDFMNCSGTFETNRISVKGNYTQPEYADWGWRTELEMISEDSFSITMYNVSPDGSEDLAVISEFERVGS